MTPFKVRTSVCVSACVAMLTRLLPASFEPRSFNPRASWRRPGRAASGALPAKVLGLPAHVLAYAQLLIMPCTTGVFADFAGAHMVLEFEPDNGMPFGASVLAFV